jgi:hypothetical protein
LGGVGEEAGMLETLMKEDPFYAISRILDAARQGFMNPTAKSRCNRRLRRPMVNGAVHQLAKIVRSFAGY